MKIRHVGTIAIVTPDGVLDGGTTTAELEASIRALAEGGNTRLIVDLSETQHINSTALGVLTSAHTNYLRRGGHMKLGGAPEAIKRIFVITKLSLCFEVYDSTEMALTSFALDSTLTTVTLSRTEVSEEQASPRAAGSTGRVPLSEVLGASPSERPGRRSPRQDTTIEASKPPPSRLVDEVQFGVASHAAMPPGTTLPLLVWVFVESARQRVMERIAQENKGVTNFQSKGPIRVPRGATLGVRVRIEGLSVRGESEGQRSTILWDGTMGNASFLVTIPSSQDHGILPGEVLITLHGFRLARLLFTVIIAPRVAPLRSSEFEEARCRTAFASYSSKDRARVLARVHGLQKAGVEVFVDVAGLRSGMKYESALLEMIDTRDVFYLFWSKSACESKWVKHEWQTALQRRGIDYIDPFPLESPEKVPPPPELGGTLHFNDWILAYLECHSSTPWWQFWRRRRLPAM